MNKKDFAVGVGLGAAVSYVWTLVPDVETAIDSSPLGFIKHYHWGLFSIFAAKHVKVCHTVKCDGKLAPYLQGLGTTLIAVDAISPEPFGMGAPPQFAVPNIALGATLLLAIIW